MDVRRRPSSLIIMGNQQPIIIDEHRPNNNVPSQPRPLYADPQREQRRQDRLNGTWLNLLRPFQSAPIRRKTVPPQHHVLPTRNPSAAVASSSMQLSIRQLPSVNLNPTPSTASLLAATTTLENIKVANLVERIMRIGCRTADGMHYTSDYRMDDDEFLFLISWIEKQKAIHQSKM